MTPDNIFFKFYINHAPLLVNIRTGSASGFDSGDAAYFYGKNIKGKISLNHCWFYDTNKKNNSRALMRKL